MKILSLFDGISCARVALERAGIPVEAYYASEIDKYAIHISQKNYPDIVRLGSVTEINDVTGKPITAIKQGSVTLKGTIDLLIGGSPCQDLSIAKKDRKGLDGERSGLFYEYLRIRNEVKPKYFILENVASMSKEARDTISKELGVEAVMINAALVSAQNRKRLFWVGKLVDGRYEQVQIPQPKDRGILLKDILEDEVDIKYKINISEKYGLKGLCEEKAKSMTASMYKGYGNDGCTLVTFRNRIKEPIRITSGGKVPTVQASWGTGGNNVPYAVSLEKQQLRKLTPIECERLQGLPDNYTEGVSNSQRYKALGNAFNVDVIAHILSFIK